MLCRQGLSERRSRPWLRILRLLQVFFEKVITTLFLRFGAMFSEYLLRSLGRPAPGRAAFPDYSTKKNCMRMHSIPYCRDVCVR